jgi:thioredoxin reductase (NADPH)
MSVFTTATENRRALATRWAEGSDLVVVLLCAAWCDTCTAFRATYERLAEARPEALFVWLDVEDDHEMAGDIDIENFPTLAIYRGEALLHYGVTLPQEGTVARLIDELAVRTAGSVDAPKPVLDLPLAFTRKAA